jgi:hypothetical protein
MANEIKQNPAALDRGLMKSPVPPILPVLPINMRDNISYPAMLPHQRQHWKWKDPMDEGPSDPFQGWDDVPAIDSGGWTGGGSGGSGGYQHGGNPAGAGGSSGSDPETEAKRNKLAELLDALQKAIDILNALIAASTTDPGIKVRLERYLRDLTNARRALTAANGKDIDEAIKILLADIEDEIFLQILTQGMEASGASKTKEGRIALLIIQLLWTYKLELGAKPTDSMLDTLFQLMKDSGDDSIQTMGSYFYYLFHPEKIFHEWGFP